jgi:hypothetical protein
MMAREAAASMTTDSGGGIDEYVNTVMTTAESSGHGRVHAVVHRPSRDSEDKPRRQSRCTARCGEGRCASATAIWYMPLSDKATCGAQRCTRAAVGAAGKYGARCCIARNAPDATAARPHGRATAANATEYTLIHVRARLCQRGVSKAALHANNRPHRPTPSHHRHHPRRAHSYTAIAAQQ